MINATLPQQRSKAFFAASRHRQQRRWRVSAPRGGAHRERRLLALHCCSSAAVPAPAPGTGSGSSDGGVIEGVDAESLVEAAVIGSSVGGVPQLLEARASACGCLFEAKPSSAAASVAVLCSSRRCPSRTPASPRIAMLPQSSSASTSTRDRQRQQRRWRHRTGACGGLLRGSRHRQQRRWLASAPRGESECLRWPSSRRSRLRQQRRRRIRSSRRCPSRTPVVPRIALLQQSSSAITSTKDSA